MTPLVIATLRCLAAGAQLRRNLEADRPQSRSQRLLALTDPNRLCSPARRVKDVGVHHGSGRLGWHEILRGAGLRDDSAALQSPAVSAHLLGPVRGGQALAPSVAARESLPGALRQCRIQHRFERIQHFYHGPGSRFLWASPQFHHAPWRWGGLLGQAVLR